MTEPTSARRVCITRTAVLETAYPPELAILLFSAEGETLWLDAADWTPAIRRGDGFGRNDVFTNGAASFVTVDFDAGAGLARYARFEPGLSAGVVEIRVSAAETGSAVEVGYHMTGLGDDGDRALAEVTDAAFAAEMRGWQAAIVANDAKIRDWFVARG